ncbi:MAG: UDP-N-acetylmuramate--L-alanine ligase [Acidobacteriota bacterium]
MFKKIQRVHFVGIGGIGMSGIAEVLLNRGYRVSGSDLKLSAVTQRLASLGAQISQGHTAENVGAADVVVISAAIRPDNPEIVEAQQRKTPIIPRAEMLAELMRMKYGITVAGTHGKTTTTSMVATVLQQARMDPTVVVGGRLNLLDSNAKLGAGEFMVVEADESDRSFLLLSPTIAVVTNIEEDHMESYAGLEDLKNAFVQFVNRVPFYGSAILCLDEPNVQSIIPEIKRRILSYGFSSQADLNVHGFEQQGFETRFQLRFNGTLLDPVRLRVPGRHNVLNAAAAAAVGLDLGISSAEIKTALESFGGADRRFQVKGEGRGITVVDDYAHHPTEIKATLEAARGLGEHRLVVIFQPHRYSRTQYCFEEFARAFYQADVLLVTDIYPAGEEPLPGVNSEKLVEAVQRHGHKNVRYVPAWEAVPGLLESELRSGDLVITMGAGNIWRVSEELAQQL